MRRLLIFLVFATLIPLVLELIFAHFGLIVLVGGAWWMWSLSEGRRNA